MTFMCTSAIMTTDICNSQICTSTINSAPTNNHRLAHNLSQECA